ncbi:MAG: hypothetical protein ACOX0A_03700 [Thermoguttaceae bacterium]|jgi:GNAT superfamily N-acetyltransferase
MEIIRVTTAQEMESFLALPEKIYKDDPNWVVPLDFQIREKFDRKKNPFFQHGWAQEFIAVDGNETVGRILVSDDDRFNAENQCNVGMFGFFESINDQNVANLLFNEGARALKEERKRDSFFGPVEFSTNYEYALLVEGFDSPPKVMMPYNPRYYQTLFENWGLKKNRDLFSWYFDRTALFADSWRPIVERLRNRYKFNVRAFSVKNFDDDVHKCMKVYDHVRSEWWWGSVSLTPEEIKSYANRLRQISLPEMVLLAEDSAGKPIGFSVTIPDLNEAARPLKGSLTWFGIPYLGALRLKYRLNRVKGVRLIVLCVLPEYRRKGVAESLILKTFDYGYYKKKYENAELGWTDENNDKISHVLDRVGAKRYKRYRVYEKDLRTFQPSAEN